MIELQDLTRRFNGNVAVDSLNLTIEDGKVFGFIGPNGAGKTTTIRMITTLISPTSGTVLVNGLDASKPSEALQIRSQVGLLPEIPGLYEALSAYKNLDFFAALYGVPIDRRKVRIRELLEMLEIWDRRDDIVGKFSKGMKQKIAIARALVHEPELLFLDEPTSGLDPEAALTVRNFLLELKKEGRTIFLNTHNLDDAERLCDTVGVMRTRLLAKGSPSELSRQFWGRTTVVQLHNISPYMISGLRSLSGVTNVVQEGDHLMIDVTDPASVNPDIVRELVHQGGQVQSVNELKRSLEDVYLRLLGGGK
ncbi:MAG: ABC transporter ATP-binding protein [Methanomassiliicoccus sp.]|nr:ABC transporter ATP-binding protein [Methanomassiliicoccus sp.]